MATPITTIASQYLHNSYEPLDASSEVKEVSDLYVAATCPPHVGKLVHVKADHRIYLCIALSATYEPTWTPVMDDNGKAFYLRSDNDEVFKITATRDGAHTGRIQVTYPGL